MRENNGTMSTSECRRYCCFPSLYFEIDLFRYRPDLSNTERTKRVLCSTGAKVCSRVGIQVLCRMNVMVRYTNYKLQTQHITMAGDVMPSRTHTVCQQKLLYSQTVAKGANLSSHGYSGSSSGLGRLCLRRRTVMKQESGAPHFIKW